jgi:hypothetical protein
LEGDLVPIDVKGAHERALITLETAVAKKMVSGVPPPNAPSTIARKKSSLTLNDSGEMLGHLTHQQSVTEEGLHGEVGFFDENIAKRARSNEYGNKIPIKSKRESEKKGEASESISQDRYIVIPARPFMRPAIDETMDKAIQQMKEDIFSQVANEFKS